MKTRIRRNTDPIARDDDRTGVRLLDRLADGFSS